MSPWDLLIAEGARPLFVHAHPDDETLQTGALLARLAAEGVETIVVTCTRGEMGEIIPGIAPVDLDAAGMVAVRERELAAAVEILGVAQHMFLGAPVARADALGPRVYRDSGMVWVREGLAGPADVTDDRSFTAAPVEEEVGDLLAAMTTSRATVLVGYDALGSYGHPDHVRVHEVCIEAARLSGLPLIEVASEPGAEGFEWLDLTDELPTVLTALQCHATQLTATSEGITHVGGQHQELPLRIGLRIA